MNIQHLNLKVFTRVFQSIQLEEFIPVFHEWIQKQGREDLLLLDVADYCHVPAGPGVMLIGHQANLSIDCAESKIGLLYNQKMALNLDFSLQLEKIARLTFEACQLLEEDSRFKGKLQFNPNEIQWVVNDRLLAPNTEETWIALEPEFKQFLGRIYPHKNLSIHRQQDPRKRFTLDVHTDGITSLSEILGHLKLSSLTS